jgi:hypothetical protein
MVFSSDGYPGRAQGGRSGTGLLRCEEVPGASMPCLLWSVNRKNCSLKIDTALQKAHWW